MSCALHGPSQVWSLTKLTLIPWVRERESWKKYKTDDDDDDDDDNDQEIEFHNDNNSTY